MKQCFFFLIASLFLLQCNYNPYRSIEGREKRYISAFPQKNTSRVIERAFTPIKKINSTAYYDLYEIDRDLRMVPNEIRRYPLDQISEIKTFMSQSAVGTATVISTNYRKLALLTCDHVVNYADTVYQYHLDEDGQMTNHVKSIAIKRQQQNIIYGLSELGSFEILAADPKRDLALLGVDIAEFDNLAINVFNVPIGQPQELEWGTFVYILGYPKGYKMVTRGIVSDPNSKSRGSFMLDALFNPGISGGMILALRGTDQHFEWVGMAKSSQITTTKVLTPAPHELAKAELYTQYRDTAYVGNITNINYGVTRPISVKEIQDFIKDIESDLRNAGFNLSHLLPN